MKIRFAALFALLFTVACSNDQPAPDDQDSVKEDTTATVDDDKPSSSLPSPLRVALMFQRSGLKYLPGLTNSPDNVTKYTTTFTRAQNMGVYSSDLAYCVLNKQTNEGQKYLKTIRDVGTAINLGKVFEQTNLYDRFNANINNNDSLGSIIADIQFQTDMQLEQNEQNELYAVIFAGAWVESMYIGAQVYRKDGNDNIVSALLEQMVVCKNIVTELKNNESKDPGIPGLITDLNDIQAAIDAMPSMKKLDENPDLEFSDLHPTKEELEPVIKKIEDLRAKIVNG
jgi:hypothetical protein